MMDVITALISILSLYILWKIVVFLKAYIYLCKLTKKTNLFPKHLIWGHLHLFSNIEEYFACVYPEVQRTRPKMYSLWASFLFPVFTFLHPDTARILLKSSEPKPKAWGQIYSFFLPWLGDGLLISQDAKWERNRRLLTPAFHFDILMPYITVYNKVADVFLDKLSKLSLSGSVEIYNPVSQATLDTMLRCSLSYEGRIQEEGDNHPYLMAVKQLTHLTMQRSMKPWYYPDTVYYMTSDGRQLTKLCDYVHQFTDKIIAKRKSMLAKDPDQLNKRHLDFLDILLTAKDETGVGLSDLDIRAEVDTFLFEGHDTTASALSWAIYCLAKYPEEQQKVFEEVNDVLQDKEYLEWGDLPNLKYLNLFIKEVMRYYAPVPIISRSLTKETEIDGVILPKHSQVDIGIYLLNHHPDVWPDHETFNPERFRDVSEEKDPFSYVPFSAGPRNCIGQNFAMNEQRVILSRLVKRFKMTLDEKHEVVLVPEIIMRAKHGIKVFLHHR